LSNAPDKPTPIPAPARPEESIGNVTVPPKLMGYFQAMSTAGASDLHLKTDSPPHMRTGSALEPMTEPPLSAGQLDEMIRYLLSDEQLDEYRHNGGVDLAYEVPGGDRFRINVFRQRGRQSIAARRVTRDIQNFEQLNLPPGLVETLQELQGLILVAGPTGSGKSTTIAAMLQHINKARRCHIITIEDPIEYLYTDAMALVQQREIGIDVPDFATALRAMMREDPDVILIGEMRDRETFEAALRASETGHLVFGTIHANTAPQTISRILELFPPESHSVVLQSLAFGLHAIICQKLLPCVKKDIPRVPAVEILRTNATVRDMISKGRTAELSDVIRSHEKDNMQSFTKSLYDLIHRDMIDPKTAYAVAPNAEELKMALKGITQSQRGLVGRR
jgi:twitching motility protein PilT